MERERRRVITVVFNILFMADLFLVLKVDGFINLSFLYLPKVYLTVCHRKGTVSPGRCAELLN